MTRKKFLSLKNHLNIPGYTEDEINGYFGVNEDGEPLVTVAEVCPICGKNYLGKNSVCLWCGYDERDDVDKTHKSWYESYLRTHPNFIACVDEE